MKTIRKISVVSKRLKVAEGSALYHVSSRIIQGPHHVAEMFRIAVPDILDAECFVAMPIDVRGRPLGIEVVHRGGVDACPVDVRSVVRASVVVNASGLVVAHNHPSGDTEPSSSDLTLTRKLFHACAAVGLSLLDHVIVTEGGFKSLSESNAHLFNE